VLTPPSPNAVVGVTYTSAAGGSTVHEAQAGLDGRFVDEFTPTTSQYSVQASWRGGHPLVAAVSRPCVLRSGDFTISDTAPTGTATQGGSVSTTIDTSAVTPGLAPQIVLATNGLPPGATAAFAPASLHAGDSSTLTISLGAQTLPGTYQLTITGSGTRPAHTTDYTLTVAPAQQQTAFRTFACTSPDPTTISCSGQLSSSAAALPSTQVTLTYQPPPGAPATPTTHTLTTGADGTFSDQLKTGGTTPLAPGSWQVRVQYAGDSAHASASATQHVTVT
jgi:hypothetical protein